MATNGHRASCSELRAHRRIARLPDGQPDHVIEKRYDGQSVDPFSMVKIDWTYDALNRLVAETRDADPTPANPSDDFGTHEAGDYSDAFGHDLAGNRISRSHAATTAGFVASASENQLSFALPGWHVAAGTKIRLRADPGGELPGGLSAGTDYYVINVSSSGGSFQVAATPGGPAIDLAIAGVWPLHLTVMDAGEVVLGGR